MEDHIGLPPHVLGMDVEPLDPFIDDVFAGLDEPVLWHPTVLPAAAAMQPEEQPRASASVSTICAEQQHLGPSSDQAASTGVSDSIDGLAMPEALPGSSIGNSHHSLSEQLPAEHAMPQLPADSIGGSHHLAGSNADSAKAPDRLPAVGRTPSDDTVPDIDDVPEQQVATPVAACTKQPTAQQHAGLLAMAGELHGQHDYQLVSEQERSELAQQAQQRAEQQVEYQAEQQGLAQAAAQQQADKQQPTSATEQQQQTQPVQQHQLHKHAAQLHQQDSYELEQQCQHQQHDEHSATPVPSDDGTSAKHAEGGSSTGPSEAAVPVLPGAVFTEQGFVSPTSSWHSCMTHASIASAASATGKCSAVASSSAAALGMPLLSLAGSQQLLLPASRDEHAAANSVESTEDATAGIVAYSSGVVLSEPAAIKEDASDAVGIATVCEFGMIQSAAGTGALLSGSQKSITGEAPAVKVSADMPLQCADSHPLTLVPATIAAAQAASPVPGDRVHHSGGMAAASAAASVAQISELVSEGLVADPVTQLQGSMQAECQKQQQPQPEPAAARQQQQEVPASSNQEQQHKQLGQHMYHRISEPGTEDELWQDVMPSSLGSSPPTPSFTRIERPHAMEFVVNGSLTLEGGVPAAGQFTSPVSPAAHTEHVHGFYYAAHTGPHAAAGPHPGNAFVAASSYLLRQSELVDLSLSTSVHPALQQLQQQQQRLNWLTAHRQLPPAAAQAVERAVCELNDSYFYHGRPGSPEQQPDMGMAPCAAAAAGGGDTAECGAGTTNAAISAARHGPEGSGRPVNNGSLSAVAAAAGLSRTSNNGIVNSICRSAQQWSHAVTQPQQDQQARHRLPSQHGQQHRGPLAWPGPSVLGQWFSSAVQQPLAVAATKAAAEVGQQIGAVAGVSHGRACHHGAVTATAGSCRSNASPVAGVSPNAATIGGLMHADSDDADAVLVELTPDMPRSLQEQEDEAFKGLLFLGGRDSHGRPVVIVNTDAIPAGTNAAPRDAALAYLVNKLTPVVTRGPYVLVLVAFNPSHQFRLLPGVWCVRAYQSLPRAFRKNVKHVLLLQPSLMVRAALALLYPFMSSKAHAKVKQVQRLLDIEVVTAGEVQVPHLGEAFLTTLQQRATQAQHAA